MSNTKHKYADILIAIANGEQIQRTDTGCEWYNAGNREVLASISLETNAQFRVKPKTININGFEVPEPLRVTPSFETEYYFPNIWEMSYSTSKAYWANRPYDEARLKRGLCHLTEAAAELHSKALRSFTKGK